MNERSRTQNSIMNMLVGFGGYGLNLLLSFICRMVFVRVLSGEYLGVNGLFSDILAVLSLAELGIGTAISYALYKPLAEKDTSEIASIIQFFGKVYRVIGLTVAAVGLCLMPFLPILIHTDLNIPENLYFIYLIYLFNSASSYFFTYRTTLMIADQRNYLVVGVNYLFIIVQNIVQITFLICTHNFIGYLYIQLVATLAYNITISRLTVKLYPFIAEKGVKPLEESKRKKIWADVRSLMIYKVSGVMVNHTDSMIITYFSGILSTGLLSNYRLFEGILRALIGYVFNGLTASVGNYNASENKEKQIKLFEMINMANFWLYGWAAIGIIVVSSDLVRLCFGAKYTMALSIPIILAINFYMVGMQSAVLTFKTTMGLFKYGRFILIFTGIFNIALSIILGRMWGVFGILLATALSRGATNAWYEPYAVYKYGLKLSPVRYLKKYIQYFIVLMMAGTLSFVICTKIDFQIVVDIILKVIICSVLANGIFWLFFHRTEAYKDAKGRVIGILKRLFRKVLRKE